MISTANLTANEVLALNPGSDIAKYRKVFANAERSGKADLRKVKVALVAVAAKWELAGQVVNMTCKVMRRHLNEALASAEVGTVKQVSQGPKLTSGSVDLGMVTDTSNFVTKEDLGIFKAEVSNKFQLVDNALAAIALAIKS
jgi:hypothetical protein